MNKGAGTLGRLFLLGFLAVTISFGFLKQVKVALRSLDNMSAPKTEAGQETRLLKQSLFHLHEPEDLTKLKIGYITNRTNKNTQERPVTEYYYDAQYVFAPLILHNGKTEADYYLLDFTSQDELMDYCYRNSLEVVATEGAMALVSSKVQK